MVVLCLSELSELPLTELPCFLVAAPPAPLASAKEFLICWMTFCKDKSSYGLSHLLSPGEPQPGLPVRLFGICRGEPHCLVFPPSGVFLEVLLPGTHLQHGLSQGWIRSTRANNSEVTARKHHRYNKFSRLYRTDQQVYQEFWLVYNISQNNSLEPRNMLF